MAHRTKLSKSQRAVVAANIDDGIAAYQPTRVELAKIIGVSLPMIQRAKRLSPLARQQVMSGLVKLGFFDRQKMRALPKPAPANDDEALRDIIRRCGVNHVVDIAAAIEAAQ
jgi:hypothetical protein